MEKWKPINYKGHWNHDPRRELLLRAQTAMDNNDSYVAIPVALAIACGSLRECKAMTVLKVDYQDDPLVLTCRMPQGHDNMYFNGAISWNSTPKEVGDG